MKKIAYFLLRIAVVFAVPFSMGYLEGQLHVINEFEMVNPINSSTRIITNIILCGCFVYAIFLLFDSPGEDLSQNSAKDPNHSPNGAHPTGTSS